jgi:tRNA-Thr(GGU) m(6)t(6)A37 methyltransferase TsaA
MKLKVVGVVRSAVKRREDMKVNGAAAQIDIRPAFARALHRIRRHSHLWVLCWLHRADRSVLRAVPRKVSSRLGESGVFALRSPDRPNPVSLTCVRLLDVRGRRLKVDALDAVDGTPVVDIKPYSPGIDCVPAARQPDYSRKYRLAGDEFLRSTLTRIARNHCGSLGSEARQAVELAFRYIKSSGKAALGPGEVLRTNLSGPGLDALFGIFNLRPGSKNIRVTAARGRQRWLRIGRTGVR